jgi:hypothetical protein
MISRTIFPVKELLRKNLPGKKLLKKEGHQLTHPRDLQCRLGLALLVLWNAPDVENQLVIWQVMQRG